MAAVHPVYFFKIFVLAQTNGFFSPNHCFERGTVMLHKSPPYFTLRSVIWRNTALSGLWPLPATNPHAKTFFFPSCSLLQREVTSHMLGCETKLLLPDFLHHFSSSELSLVLHTNLS